MTSPPGPRDVRRTAGAALAAAGALFLAYAFIVQPHARVSSIGDRVFTVDEFGRGAAIQQSFDAASDGLSEIRVQFQSASATRIDVEYQLSERRNDQLIDVGHGRETVAVSSSAAWHAFRFAPIAQSEGKSYVLRLRAPAPAPGVSIVASRDRPLRRTAFVVDGQERWGSLVFDATADSDSWIGRFRLKGLPALPPAFRSMPMLEAALVLYVALLVVWGVVVWPAASGPRPARRDGLARSVALACLVAAACAGATLVVRADRGRINLIDDLPSADLQSSSALHQAFDVESVEIATETKRVLFTHATSRVAWRVTVPSGAHLVTDIGIHPTVWVPGGDGIYFRIQTIDGGVATEQFARHLNPHLLRDRRWVPVDIDLSSLAGRTIQIVLVAEPSLPGAPVDPSYDWAIWAEPRVR